MIRKAEAEDIPAIMAIVNEVKEQMGRCFMGQWGDDYPLAEDFLEDLSSGSLYVLSSQGEIDAFCTLDDNPLPSYQGIPFLAPRHLVLHRFAVRKDVRGKCLGRELLAWAKQCAFSSSASLVSDTGERNAPMRSLFNHMDGQMRGSVHFPSRHIAFLVYEFLA